MNDAQSCDEELLCKLDSAASPEVSGMLNRYFVAALCESAAARLRFKDAAIDNLAAEVERLREERRWIPVSERLPDRDEAVFLRDKGGVQYIGCLSHDEVGECWCRADGEPWYDGDGWSCYADMGDYKPTHWHPFPQPLPQPPEKQ